MATYYAFDYDILGAILFCKCDDVFPYSNLKYDKEVRQIAFMVEPPFILIDIKDMKTYK